MSDSKKRKVFLKFKADSSSWVLGSGPYRRKGCIGNTLHRCSWEIRSGYVDNGNWMGGVWCGTGFVWDLESDCQWKIGHINSLFVDWQFNSGLDFHEVL